jgi:predicted MPP superfamily phosphohydrolase
MKKKITRRAFIKGTLGGLFTLFGVGLGGYTYANRIEPQILDVNHQYIQHRFIPKSFDGIRMIQFSDTHLGFQYTLGQLTSLIKKIMALRPDLILFTGDLLDAPNKFSEINRLVQLLEQLSAPLGKYCIYGNHDHGGYGTELYRNLMETAGFTVLLNEAHPIKLKDGGHIYLVGIDDAMLGQPDLALALKHVPPLSFKLLLSHAPDWADRVAAYPIQWQLSGHSHGGQVKIPFVGALITPPFARKYTEGLYKIGNTGSLSLYVNRGIGTTRLPFRFMARPELTVFTLKPI